MTYQHVLTVYCRSRKLTTVIDKEILSAPKFLPHSIQARLGHHQNGEAPKKAPIS